MTFGIFVASPEGSAKPVPSPRPRMLPHLKKGMAPPGLSPRGGLAQLLSPRLALSDPAAVYPEVEMPVASGRIMQAALWRKSEKGIAPPPWSTRSRHMVEDPAIPLPPLVPLQIMSPRRMPAHGVVLTDEHAEARLRRENTAAAARKSRESDRREPLSLERLQATSSAAVESTRLRQNQASPRNHGGGTRDDITARAARFSAAAACQSLLEGVAHPEEVAYDVMRSMDRETALAWMVTFCRCVERTGATLDSTQRQLIAQQEQMDKFLEQAGLEWEWEGEEGAGENELAVDEGSGPREGKAI